jgi:hypothetical protein
MMPPEVFICAMPGTTKGIGIIASQVGDLAGIIGGAVLAKQRVK